MEVACFSAALGVDSFVHLFDDFGNGGEFSKR